MIVPSHPLPFQVRDSSRQRCRQTVRHSLLEPIRTWTGGAQSLGRSSGQGDGIPIRSPRPHSRCRLPLCLVSKSGHGQRRPHLFHGSKLCSSLTASSSRRTPHPEVMAEGRHHYQHHVPKRRAPKMLAKCCAWCPGWPPTLEVLIPTSSSSSHLSMEDSPDWPRAEPCDQDMEDFARHLYLHLAIGALDTCGTLAEHWS